MTDLLVAGGTLSVAPARPTDKGTASLLLLLSPRIGFWSTDCRGREALLGFFVEVGRERASFRDAMLLARWTGFDVPTIVVDRPGWLSANRRTNFMLPMAASLSRSAMPEVSQLRWPTPGSLALRSGPPVLAVRRGTACRAARDEHACAGIGGHDDEFLVIRLDRRVPDLEDVEDAHPDVIGQVRQDARHTDEADLAFGLEALGRVDLGPLGPTKASTYYSTYFRIFPVNCGRDVFMFGPELGKRGMTMVLPTDIPGAKLSSGGEVSRWDQAVSSL